MTLGFTWMSVDTKKTHRKSRQLVCLILFWFSKKKSLWELVNEYLMRFQKGVYCSLGPKMAYSTKMLYMSFSTVIGQMPPESASGYID